MSGGVLVAGVGNIFLGDDGFGVEVARRLAARQLPAGVRVEDFGIRGLHLAFELLNGYDALVLLDAMAVGESPGTVTVLEAELPSQSPTAAVDAHTMSPDAVLATLAELGGSVAKVVVIGCEPAEVSPRIGLSEPLAGAVDRAVGVALEVARSLAGEAVR